MLWLALSSGREYSTCCSAERDRWECRGKNFTRTAMLADPIRLLRFCEEIEETPHDRLREMDRETLLGVRASPVELERQVDRTLLRLSFVDEQQSN